MKQTPHCAVNKDSQYQEEQGILYSILDINTEHRSASNSDSPQIADNSKKL